MMGTTNLQGDDAPVQTFADCHRGIIDTMRDLEEFPSLLNAARRVRSISERIEEFFDQVVLVHHREEENQLFPAVLASAAEGAERAEVGQIISRLTMEHHDIETALTRLVPAIREVGKTLKDDLKAQEIESLVAQYLTHARFEEEVFLPLAKTILGRNGNHMAALGLALHIRHNAGEIRRSFGIL
jgi:hemerythrin-like domain-containing protein